MVGGCHIFRSELCWGASVSDFVETEAARGRALGLVPGEVVLRVDPDGEIRKIATSTQITVGT